MGAANPAYRPDTLAHALVRYSAWSADALWRAGQEVGYSRGAPPRLRSSKPLVADGLTRLAPPSARYVDAWG